MIPKILRSFPTEICRRWIVHVKRQGLSEGDILKQMEFLGEEVDGALTAPKILGDTLDNPDYIPSAAALHVNFSTRNQDGRTDIRGTHSASFVSQRVTGRRIAGG